MSVRITVEHLTDAGATRDRWGALLDSDIDTVLIAINNILTELHSSD